MPAPDGGWGWAVVVGVGVTFAVTTGPISCFGLIFDEWLREVNADTSDFTFLSGLYFSLSFMPGVLARPLLRLFSCRQISVVGALLCALGCASAALCDSVASLVVSYSVLQGIGMGLLLPAAFTSLNTYFRRRRTLAVAAAQLLAATGAALYPALVHALMRQYGFRGTQAVLGALSLHAVAGAATMRPAPTRRFSRGQAFSRRLTLVARAGAPLEARSARSSLFTDDDLPLVKPQTPEPLPPPPASFPPDDVPPPIIEEENEDGSPQQRNRSTVRSTVIEGQRDPRAASPSDSPVLSRPPRTPIASSPPAFRKDFPRPAIVRVGGGGGGGGSGDATSPTATRRRRSQRHRHQRIHQRMGSRRHSHRRRSSNSSQKPAVSFDARPAYIEASPERSPGKEGGVEDGEVDGARRVDETPPPPPLSARARLAQRRPTGPFLYSSRRGAQRDSWTGTDSDDPSAATTPRSSSGALPHLRRLSVILLARQDNASSSSSESEDEPARPPPSALRNRKQSVAAVAAGAAAALMADDWAMIRSRGFAVTALGAAMAVFSDGMWMALVPLHAAALGLTPGQSARLVAGGSAGDVLGRAALVAGARWAQGRSRLVFFVSCLLALPLRCGYAATSDAVALTALAAALGVLGACRQVALPLLFAERLPAARFPAAFGLFLLSVGLSHLLLGPFVGLVRDATGSYPACLGTLAALLLLCLVPWTLELVLHPPPVVHPALLAVSVS